MPVTSVRTSTRGSASPNEPRHDHSPIPRRPEPSQPAPSTVDAPGRCGTWPRGSPSPAFATGSDRLEGEATPQGPVAEGPHQDGVLVLHHRGPLPLQRAGPLGHQRVRFESLSGGGGRHTGRRRCAGRMARSRSCGPRPWYRPTPTRGPNRSGRTTQHGGDPVEAGRWLRRPAQPERDGLDRGRVREQAPSRPPDVQVPDPDVRRHPSAVTARPPGVGEAQRERSLRVIADDGLRCRTADDRGCTQVDVPGRPSHTRGPGGSGRPGPNGCRSRRRRGGRGCSQVNPAGVEIDDVGVERRPPRPPGWRESESIDTAFTRSGNRADQRGPAPRSGSQHMTYPS